MSKKIVVAGLSVIVVSLAVMWLSSTASADTQICTKEEAQAAEAVAATARSWGRLHQQFRRYAHCDDGAIAEGFSESVTILLADDWGTIRQLGAVVTSDPAFRKFVIRHIDETVPVERLKQIAKNASKRCPPNLKHLCNDIQAAATQQ